MALYSGLSSLLQESGLSSEEIRAFELGLGFLSLEEQQTFAKLLADNKELIYPLYINYKAKLKAMREGETSWDALIEKELEEFQNVLDTSKVGKEIK